MLRHIFYALLGGYFVAGVLIGLNWYLSRTGAPIANRGWPGGRQLMRQFRQAKLTHIFQQCLLDPSCPPRIPSGKEHNSCEKIGRLLVYQLIDGRRSILVQESQVLELQSRL